MARMTLSRYLIEAQREKGTLCSDLRLLIEVVSRACKSISIAIGKGLIVGEQAPITTLQVVVSQSEDPTIVAMRNELTSMRQMIERRFRPEGTPGLSIQVMSFGFPRGL